MYSGAGLILCGIVILVAIFKSNRRDGSFYAREVYGMTPRSHLVYAALSGMFAAAFAASYVFSAIPAVPLLAAYVLVFVFYVSSFARGFGDEE